MGGVNGYSHSFDFRQLRKSAVVWWRHQGGAGAGCGAVSRLRMADNWVTIPSGSFCRGVFELGHAGASALVSCGAHRVRREGRRSGAAGSLGSFILDFLDNLQPAWVPYNLKTQRAVSCPRRSFDSGQSPCWCWLQARLRTTNTYNFLALPMCRVHVWYYYTSRSLSINLTGSCE